MTTWPYLGGTNAITHAAQLQAALDYTDSLVGATVDSYDADPTGVADSTDAFQAMLDAGDIVLGTGTYSVGFVSYEGSEDRTIRVLPGHKATIVQTDILGVFSLRGGWDALGTVSSVAGANADGNDDGTTNSAISQLTMSGATTVTKGDIVKIVSADSPYGYDTAPAGLTTRRGEYSMVMVDSTGTTVSLANPLVDTYTTSVRLARLWDVTFRVEGDLTFTCDTDLFAEAGYTAAVELRAAKYCVVDGVTFDGVPGRAIANYTFASRIQNIRFKNLSNRPSLSHYGYGIGDGGFMTRISNCHGENLRHMVSENSNEVTETSANYEYFGGGWHGLVSDCTASNCQSSAFDTHESAYGYTFENCKAFGAFFGAGSTGAGFTLRGRKGTCKDCESTHSQTGFNVAVYTDALIENCTSYGHTNHALHINPSTAGDVAITAQSGVVVKGGFYEGNVPATATGRVVQVCASGGPATTVDFQSVHMSLLTGASGSMFMDVYRAPTIRMDGCTFDARKWGTAGTAPLGVFLRDTGGSVTCYGLRIHVGATLTAAMQLCTGATGSNTCRVRFYDYDYEATNGSATGLTKGHANLTNMKWSGFERYGTSWFQMNKTNSNTMVASAAASLAAYALLLDDHIFVRLTGSNGNVTLGSLGAVEMQGQRITFINKSNGIVTVNSVAVAIDGSVTFVWGTGSAAWHTANVYP
jgi:hypothetical protein